MNEQKKRKKGVETRKCAHNELAHFLFSETFVHVNWLFFERLFIVG